MLISFFFFYFLDYFIVKLEASYFDRINMTKNGLEYDQKNSHRRTWMLELDRMITTMNLNCRTWPKYGWIWPKIDLKKNIKTMSDEYRWCVFFFFLFLLIWWGSRWRLRLPKKTEQSEKSLYLFWDFPGTIEFWKL